LTEQDLPKTGGVLLIALFPVALFLSAFLMFTAEPMIAKMVLPILGGAPMVWNTCLIFFQMALLRAGADTAYTRLIRALSRPPG
jgi:hypothetical protein